MNSEPSLTILEAIVSNMAEGVIFLDAHGVVRICNPAAERIRRVNASRIVGRSIFDLHPPRMHHRIHELLDSLKAGMIASNDRMVRAQSRVFDNSYAAIRDETGAFLGTLLVSRDVTEQRRLFEENQSLRSTLVGHGGMTGRGARRVGGLVLQGARHAVELQAAQLGEGMLHHHGGWLLCGLMGGSCGGG